MYEKDALKAKLDKTFDMKDYCNADHPLGMHILNDKTLKQIFLTQRESICKVLQHFNMEGGEGNKYSVPSIYES